MEQPTREEVEAIKRYWWNRDEVIRIADAYLGQEEELEAVGLEKHTMCKAWESQNQIIEQLKAENQALKERVEAMVQAIKDEPELPGPMPDGMLNDIEKAGIEETMRVVVRETKMGILRRINL